MFEPCEHITGCLTWTSPPHPDPWCATFMPSPSLRFIQSHSVTNSFQMPDNSATSPLIEYIHSDSQLHKFVFLLSNPGAAGEDYFRLLLSAVLMAHRLEVACNERWWAIDGSSSLSMCCQRQEHQLLELLLQKGELEEGGGAVHQTCRTVPQAVLELFLKMAWGTAGISIGSGK